MPVRHTLAALLALALLICGAPLTVGLGSALFGSRLDLAKPAASPHVKVLAGGGHGSATHIGRGYFITAAHVVSSSEAVTIKAEEGFEVEGEVLWANKATDVAMVRVKDASRFRAVPMSCRMPALDEQVTAYGNPGSVEFVSTRGRIVSGLRQMGPWREVVITDMTIVMGMSGGGVIDRHGYLVGISVGVMTASLGFMPSLTGIGVIVPASTICGVMGRSA